MRTPRRIARLRPPQCTCGSREAREPCVRAPCTCRCVSARRPRSRKPWTTRSERSGAQSSTPLNARCRPGPTAGTAGHPPLFPTRRSLPMRSRGVCPLVTAVTRARVPTADAASLERKLLRGRVCVREARWHARLDLGEGTQGARARTKCPAHSCPCARPPRQTPTRLPTANPGPREESPRCLDAKERPPWRPGACAQSPNVAAFLPPRCTTASAPFASRILKRALGSGARHAPTRLARIASSRTSGLSSTRARRTPARTNLPTPTPCARCAVRLLTRRRRRRRSWRRRQTGAVTGKKTLPRPPKKTPPRPPRQEQHRRPGAAPLPSPRLASQRLPRAARQAAAARRRLPSPRRLPRSSAQASLTATAGRTARQHVNSRRPGSGRADHLRPEAPSRLRTAGLWAPA